MKINAVNVIEYIDDAVSGVTTFSQDDEGKKEAVDHFSACAKENGADEKDILTFLEDGWYEQGTYQVFITYTYAD